MIFSTFLGIISQTPYHYINSLKKKKIFSLKPAVTIYVDRCTVNDVYFGLFTTLKGYHKTKKNFTTAEIPIPCGMGLQKYETHDWKYINQDVRDRKRPGLKRDASAGATYLFLDILIFTIYTNSRLNIFLICFKSFFYLLR